MSYTGHNNCDDDDTSTSHKTSQLGIDQRTVGSMRLMLLSCSRLCR